MYQKYIISFLSLVLILLLASCGSTSQGSLPETDPEEVVKGFYDWYLGDRSGPPKDARESGLLADELVTRINKTMESEVPVDQINFVCAQDFPEYVEVVSSEIEGDEAEVLVQTSFGSEISLDLQIEDGQWLIVDVTCR